MRYGTPNHCDVLEFKMNNKISSKPVRVFIIFTFLMFFKMHIVVRYCSN